tara:strand:- start:192 stop:1481 length:1290 start_codon:yes stop_codon:yes gene_type:complete
MLSLLSLTSTAYDSAWPSAAYHAVDGSSAASPIQMDMGAFTKSSKAGGPLVHEWQPATNFKGRGARSWTSVVLNDGERPQYGIMYAQDDMTGTDMPRADQKVAVYLADASSVADLERGGEKASITLMPVTEMMSAQKSQLKHERKSRASLSEEDEDEDEDMDLERMPDPAAVAVAATAAAATLPLVWGPFGPFMAAGFLPYFAAASMLTPSLEADLEVSKAVALKRHSRPLQLAIKGRKVSFKSALELERKQFLPFVGVPFLFFPWGFALGSAYFTVAATAWPMLAASMPLTPWATWFKGDHKDLFKDMSTTYVKYLQQTWSVRMWWAFNAGGYWGWLMYSIYWQPALVQWWLGFFKYWTEYAVKVYKFWTDYWKTAGEKWSSAVTAGIGKMPYTPPYYPLPIPSPSPAPLGMIPAATPTPTTLNAAHP